ncbi:PREDICTED: uncharacterized protein LOC109232674 [Nicotiana attenuata]|uniref:uncharacterized protein LOC109232674 n=1 Tax=Nicotiana attenuata TaxID=49451 RepID=UPI000904A295|nr:PREDICTED: uncharacterized protein LOC109232674 [Nicotiana attenuata]
MNIDPPDSPTKPANSTNQSYLCTLISHNNISSHTNQPYSLNPSLNITDETEAPTDPSIFIPLSLEEKNRLYTPWKHAVIIKVFGRKVGHQLLRQKIYAQWKPTENLPLIDLGSHFFLIKFQKEENKLHALQDGPWFISNHFLSVRQWEPKFMASETKITYSAIWLRLPELPTEFYDLQILKKLGNKIGKLLTVDTCTSTTTRGRYARLCIEVPLDQPFKTHLFISSHKQTILYEGLNMLYINCGRLGHNQRACTYHLQQNFPQESNPLHQSQTTNPTAILSSKLPTPSTEE